jgi:hypothetical protein
MSESYTYSIAADTANGAVNTSVLGVEILGGGTDGLNDLSHIETMGDVLTIVFDNALTAGEEDELDYIVGYHDGMDLEPTAEDEEQLAAFTEADGGNYRLFTYTGSYLTRVETFADATHLELVYTKDYTYTDGKLTQQTLVRHSDDALFVRTYAYDGPKLDEIGA